jgi:hypothetical protein
MLAVSKLLIQQRDIVEHPAVERGVAVVTSTPSSSFISWRGGQHKEPKVILGVAVVPYEGDGRVDRMLSARMVIAVCPQILRQSRVRLASRVFSEACEHQVDPLGIFRRHCGPMPRIDVGHEIIARIIG